MTDPSPGRRPPKTASGPVTLADVAAAAGVHRSVVSRILNAKSGISVREDTRLRVLRAADDLGYRPNSAAQSLRTSKARAFGLIVPDFLDPLYGQVIQGAEEAAAEHDWVVLTASTQGKKKALRGHLDRISSGRVDGLMFAGGRIAFTTAEMAGFRLPWLLLNRRTPRARRFVILDNTTAAELAVAHLLELGHQRIAYVTGPAWADAATQRRAGYERALAAAGLDLDERLVATSEYTFEAGAASTDELLTRGVRPTAIFADSWMTAVGVLKGLSRAGVRVPKQMSVVTIHDVPLAEHLSPPLTAVRMPMHQLGRRGVELLLGTRADEPITETLDGPIELVVRASTAPPPRG